MIEMEYAEGGNLAQYLAVQTQFLKEPTILEMFSEMIVMLSTKHCHCNATNNYRAQSAISMIIMFFTG